uniref:RNA methyltransferase n=1 Tax=Anaerobacillus isosaccharinicus TaxID=1532552 RepID=A0A1S2LWB9_9BACI
MEMRSLFGFDTKSSKLESPIQIDPSRSPFIKERIGVLFEADSLDELERQVANLPIIKQTFKVLFILISDQPKKQKVVIEERRAIERKIGVQLKGEVDLREPERLFAITKVNERWIFGDLIISEAIWLKHQKKPHNYSTALSTRVARAVVNIAVPFPKGIKVIDPCCGIGTVLIEALSMGIDIIGSDLNPLILSGTRENIAYFGFSTIVTKGDIRNVTDHFDVAIIDMPYNLCSVLAPEEQLEMLRSARKFAKRVVVVTVEAIDHLIGATGFKIIDRCVAKKSMFSREVIVCE